MLTFTGENHILQSTFLRCSNHRNSIYEYICTYMHMYNDILKNEEHFERARISQQTEILQCDEKKKKKTENMHYRFMSSSPILLWHR